MGIVIDSNGVIDIAASTPGKYRITYTTAGTCPSSSFQDITINALPTISISGTDFCAGQSTTLTATPSTGTFVWEVNTGSGFNVISGQFNNTISVSTAGDYRAKVIDANGCTSDYSTPNLTIAQFDSPSVTIATVPGATICTGDTATLTANVTGGTGTISYLWSNSDTTQEISVAPTTTTTYSVTVTDDNGCTAQASQEITPSTNGTTIASINNDAAMSFNGTDTYIGVDNYVFGGLTELTISFWYNLNTVSGDQAVVAKWMESQGILLYHDDPSGWRFLLKLAGGSTAALQSTFTATPNTWEHIAVTWKSGEKVKIYLNGTNVEESSAAFNGTSATVSDFNIGRDALTGANTRYLDGKLDELAAWDKKLSSCDIKGIYEGSIGSNAGKAANLLDANTTIPAPVYWNRMGDS